MKGNNLDIYLIDMSSADQLLSAAERILTADELRKSRSYLKSQDTRNFIVHKTAEKLLLARYLECRPDEIQLRHTSLGKPIGGDHLQYSKSHSGDALVFAFSRSEVGIDLEEKKLLPDAEELLLDVLHSDESFSVDEFFHVWTQKEAYLKFLGTGLNVPMNLVKLLSPDANSIHAVCGTSYPDAQLQAVSLTSFPNHLCYVAVSLNHEPEYRMFEHAETLAQVLNLIRL